MPTGRIVRAIAGFFYIEPQHARASEQSPELIESSVRGKLKLGSEGILVGDFVEYSVNEGKGVITSILPRRTMLKRPYIANVDLIVLVFSHCNPDPNEHLISKFLILAESAGIPYLLVFNKTDLVRKGKADELANIYRNYGYQVFCTSVVTHLGKRSLLKALSGKVAVFAGPSGVGKSALLNMLSPGFNLQTGAISEKIGRGKHTTREVQLFKVNNSSYIADTPGFTQIALDFLKPEDLAYGFPEFGLYRNSCRFNTCIHHTEPGCGVINAVNEGKIGEERYQNYLELLKEVRKNWDNRYR